jgi:phosphatidylglycerol---prolipoprotein diacylglyceryl transferase
MRPISIKGWARVFLEAITFPNIDPAALTLGPFGDVGPFHLRWYALAYIAGLLLGWRWMVWLIRRDKLWAPGKAPLSVPQVDDFLFWATLGVILGGRLGYVLFYKPDMIWTGPLEVFQIWHGGMAFHGGLIGVALATWWFCRQQKLPMLRLGDLAAAATPLGLFFGRIANFINGELWGRPTDAPWGMVFCNDTIRAASGGGCPAGLEPRHPSQLYEATLEGVVLFAIINIAIFKFDSLKRPGLNVGLFLVCYGVVRLLLEFVREPDAHMPDALRGFVTMGMLLSLPMIAAGAWLIRRAFAAPKLA